MIKYAVCFIVFFVFMIFSSCKNKTTESGGECIHINFDESLEKHISLSDIADSLKFTFLQYDEANLVGEILNYKITDNYILLVDQQQKLFVFKRDGKLLTVIDGKGKGKGPSEYVNIEDFLVDSAEKSIIILDPRNGKVIKYDIEGNYLSSYSMEYNHAAHIGALDDGGYCVYQSARFSKSNSNIFLTDDSFKTTDSIKDRGDGDLLKKIPYLLDAQWYCNENSILFKEALVDTVYKVTNTDKARLQPHIFLDYGDRKIPQDYYTNTQYYQKRAHRFYQVGKITESQQYVFLMMIHENSRKYYLFHKKGEHQFLYLGKNGLKDDSLVDLEFWPEYIHGNTVSTFIGAGELYGKLDDSEKAKGITKILETNDNPVLITFELM
ncbi:6-bladed beta-propeller [Puteibacter caeruleilacunae]|nr:6-bladed beta-propeller [Puteibacter caeruleilacunae]